MPVPCRSVGVTLNWNTSEITPSSQAASDDAVAAAAAASVPSAGCLPAETREVGCFLAAGVAAAAVTRRLTGAGADADAGALTPTLLEAAAAAVGGGTDTVSPLPLFTAAAAGRGEIDLVAES